MDLDIASLTLTGLLTFGTVWVLGLFVEMDTRVKFLASVIVALVAGFIPADLGNELATRIKDAYIVASSVAGAYQGVAKVAERIAR